MTDRKVYRERPHVIHRWCTCPTVGARVRRNPFRERPHTLERWCTCDWVWTDEDGQPKRHRMHSRDPHCKLHGDQAKEAPF
jgi:hypothetical protein